MATEVKIDANVRSEFGKGAARRTRRDGKVPAVIYGHGSTPRHVSLPAHALMMALKESNVLIELNIEGSAQLVLPKSVVRHAIKGSLEHVDFIEVRRGEKVVVDVPVHSHGESDRDGIVEHVHNTVQVRAEATSIPAELIVDITGLAVGHSAHASDIKLPAGVELVSPADTIIIHIGAKPTAAAVEAAPAAAEAAPAAPAAE
jgi:large subunit ribosomal protein L25